MNMHDFIDLSYFNVFYNIHPKNSRLILLCFAASSLQLNRVSRLLVFSTIESLFTRFGYKKKVLLFMFAFAQFKSFLATEKNTLYMLYNLF